MSEQLCYCAHLTSDHESTAEWTPEQLAMHGSPCNRCNADPHKEQRKFYDVFCTGFREWKLMDMPWPGTFAAREVGCVCPVGVNLQAKKEGTLPVYGESCPVHDWVCKLGSEVCTHVEGGTAWSFRHDRPHESCEHCTVPQIVCGGCGQVWADWRVTPEKAGWTGTAIVHKPRSIGPSTMSSLSMNLVWRCGTCAATS